MTLEGRVTVDKGIVFGTGGDRDLHCDVYRPPGTVENAPCVILLHGGAWRMGDREQLRGYGIRLGREGYVCVASEYRLVPDGTWPAQIHDVKAAIRWVRANAASLGVDPNRIAVEGNSAGAHLALLAAGTVGIDEFEGVGGNPGVSTDVAAVVGIYPPTVLATVAGELGAVPMIALHEGGTAEMAKAASPLTHVRAGFPPTLLIHGSADTTVPVGASLRIYEALAAAGVPVDMHIYADQPHAFDMKPEFGRQCAAEMLLFLDRYVRDASPAREEATPAPEEVHAR